MLNASKLKQNQLLNQRLLTSFSLSFSSASFSFTRSTNIWRISSSLLCNSAKWFERFASNVCWNETCQQKKTKTKWKSKKSTTVVCLRQIEMWTIEAMLHTHTHTHLPVYYRCQHLWIPFARDASDDTIHSVWYASFRACLPYWCGSAFHEVSQNRNDSHFQLKIKF